MSLSGMVGLGTAQELPGLGVVPLDLIGLLPVGRGGEESVIQPQVRGSYFILLAGVGYFHPPLD